MKKWGSLLALVCAVTVGLYLSLNPAKNSPIGRPASNNLSAAQNETTKTPTNSTGGTIVASSSPATTNLADRAGMVPTPETAENIPPAIVLENVDRAVRQYGSMFGGNPVGTNPEITAALNGGNPKQINFISPEAGLRINENGELVDGYDTPLFFHQISGTEMEIHSAGPDKIMWTSDDLISK